MKNVPCLFVLFLVTVCSSSTETEHCPFELSRCSCGHMTYDRHFQYVVNCTDSQFTNTLALKHLPPETQVLIFTGNNITQLPWNVFGTLENYEKLTIVDMSNNQIHQILGKSYHHVGNVRRLILNHNQISISDEDHHPRIFSNFENLEELHLTNAFVDNAKGLGTDLHDIFINSNLTKLIKLHLEQNEIIRFRDREVFCDLPRLMDLHLGDNHLSQIDFRIDCLKYLRYIDLEGNNITRLKQNEMTALDALPARGQDLEINLSDNPFSCECGIHQLYDWMQATKVKMSDTRRVRCHRGDGELPPKHPEAVICDEPVRLAAVMPPTGPDAAGIVLGFLSVIIVALVAFLVYNYRKSIHSRLQPMVETVSRKVYYSSIEHDDDREIDV